MRTSFFVLAAGLLLAGRLPGDPVAPPPAGPSVVGQADAPPKPDATLYPRTPDPVGPAHAASSMGGTTAMLLVVLLGAAGGWVFWRKLRGVRDTAGRGGQKLAIAETRSLGNRQFLVVAAYGERKFLLGVCPGRIDLLSPLEGGQPPPP